MKVTNATKLGRIAKDATARERFTEVVPGVIDSPYFSMLRNFDLDRLGEVMGEGASWVEKIVGAFDDVELPVDRGQAVVPSPDYESADVERSSASATVPAEASRWGVAEIVLDGPSHGNPFTGVVLDATFSDGDRELVVPGFYDGDGRYLLRCMPDVEGRWSFETTSNARSLDGIEGQFACTPAMSGAHGPVRVDRTFHFRHADGTPYRPFGTTCYAWTHQTQEVEERTLATLAAAPFNKVRMCVFPKSYLYNENEPEREAFVRADDGTFDLDRFEPEFFRHLEERVADLAALGIEADVILFHGYDRWGYEDLGSVVDDRFLRYVVARLGAFANVWWSLANEYDLMWSKEAEDWERFGTIVSELDAFGHLLGVHNGPVLYDNDRPWVTHSSVQKTEDFSTTENVTKWRDRWQKPVVVDEYGYEGDVDTPWGNICPEELVRRSWEAVVRGGYVTHGECFLDPDDVLWWAKGGDLHGVSTARFAFLRDVVEAAPGPLEPLPKLSVWGYSTAGIEDEYVLQYYGFFQPRLHEFNMSEASRCRYEIIDTWNMSITDAGVHQGPHTVALPGRPYMAVRVTKT